MYCYSMKTRKIHKKSKAKKTCGKKFPRKRHGKTHRKKHTTRKRGGDNKDYMKKSIVLDTEQRKDADSFINSTENDNDIIEKYNIKAKLCLTLFNSCKKNCYDSEGFKVFKEYDNYYKNLSNDDKYKQQIKQIIDNGLTTNWMNNCRFMIEKCENYYSEIEILEFINTNIQKSDKSDFLKNSIKKIYDDLFKTITSDDQSKLAEIKRLENEAKEEKRLKYEKEEEDIKGFGTEIDELNEDPQ